jgi:hypothetical protein
LTHIPQTQSLSRHEALSTPRTQPCSGLPTPIPYAFTTSVPLIPNSLIKTIQANTKAPNPARISLPQQYLTPAHSTLIAPPPPPPLPLLQYELQALAIKAARLQPHRRDPHRLRLVQDLDRGFLRRRGDGYSGCGWRAEGRERGLRGVGGGVG